ncbi:MAG: Txe/YoeB family addiction module toxin [Bacteroidota bacterium]
MQIVFSQNGWTDFTYWLENDRKLVIKVAKLISAIRRDPYTGIGKPERLKHDLSGYWSRRINQEHRIVYEVNERAETCTIISCRHHY